ncbi:hypothetical protein CYLTODRAFT_422366 [Cylindrobasidium torrendii FP15055 ss-10]|uniref:F-box domain-containing protein n=1 Tax=Cylindrobasidium torrendii FP15055 ss-10 TaxID=1314674 RepID=A0A0D7BAU7_9AGAR|nr:hypothetical protein CYLTODRAFT_422366 [Cylindrobasidium torrendii FP15055 ss-10]
MSSITTLPQEILEQIAYTAATDTISGPPSSLPSLLALNHDFHDRLSMSSNPTLYARIFAFKFDTSIAFKRFGVAALTQAVLAIELKRRFTMFKRLRSHNATTDSPFCTTSDTAEMLYYAYLLMLENEGKNQTQLRDYAQIVPWLHDYWFTPNGQSLGVYSLQSNTWPEDHDCNSIAMWLYWFLSRPDQDTDHFTGEELNVLKLYSISAHKFQLSSLDWAEFKPSPCSPTPLGTIKYYSQDIHLALPPCAVPAVMSFLRLVDFASRPAAPNRYKALHDYGNDLEGEWLRCLRLGGSCLIDAAGPAFIPGSLEGAWEGLFTYTEFNAYAALLRGAAPSVLTASLVVKHRQTWILKEHYFVDNGEDETVLPPGDPLHSYLPAEAQLKKEESNLLVLEGGKTYKYVRTALDRARIRDIIVTGRGHSAWGEFDLFGRIRPFDGFVSLSKDYVDGERGRWIYRGFVVGNNLAGRWRDCLSPLEVQGYEGCFSMSRRR